MPRPLCPRKIRHTPPVAWFKPAGIPLRELKEVQLRADEMEALRLSDLEGFYRADAAAQMGVSRQTFDRIVREAHRKVASALVNGWALRIADKKLARVVEERSGGPGRKCFERNGKNGASTSRPTTRSNKETTK